MWWITPASHQDGRTQAASSQRRSEARSRKRAERGRYACSWRLAAHSFAELFTEVAQPLDDPVFLTLLCMGRVGAILTSPRQALGEGHQSLRSTWSAQGREAGRVALPQATERTAQAVERSTYPTQMPARAMTEVAQEPASQRLIRRLQQVQEKGIGQRRQGQELLALLPTPQPWTSARPVRFC